MLIGTNTVLFLTASFGAGALVLGAMNDRAGSPTAIAELPAERLQGERVTLLDGVRSTVFLVMSPTCSVASKVIPKWAVQLEGSLPTDIRLVGLAFDVDGREAVARYLRRRHLNVETFLVPQDMFSATTGMTIVPSVLVVDSKGQITMKHEGALIEGTDLRDRVLGVVLQGSGTN